MRIAAIAITLLTAAGLLLSTLPAPERSDTLPGVIEQLRLLERRTNDARRGTLEMLLEARSIPYELEHFEVPRPGARRSAGANVVVTLGSGARDLIVGAHFDAASGGDGLTGGALDNGAGVIALVHLADRLRSERLRHRIRILFFDMEEVGLLGSTHHIARMDRDRVAGAVNVDVVGRGDTVVLGPSRHSGNEQMYEAAAAACGALRESCMEFPHYAPSDDIAFQRSGIANLSVGLLPRLEAHQFWLQLNGGDNAGLARDFVPATPAMLHTAADRPEAVDPASVTRAFDFLLELVRRLDSTLPGV